MGKPSGKHFEPRAARSCIGVTQISGTEAVGEEMSLYSDRVRDSLIPPELTGYGNSDTVYGVQPTGRRNKRHGESSFVLVLFNSIELYSRIRSRAESDVCNLCIIGEMLQRRRTPNFSE